MEHHLSPTGVAALLLLALALDYWSVGPNSLRDRLAFLMAIVVFREGWNGSPLDQWIVGKLTALIQAGLDANGGAYIAGASAVLIVSCLVSGLIIYGVCCLAPQKLATKKFGGWARTTLPTSGLHRINWKLWALAILLGLLMDLSRGWVGSVATFGVDTLASLAPAATQFVFGVS